MGKLSALSGRLDAPTSGYLRGPRSRIEVLIAPGLSAQGPSSGTCRNSARAEKLLQLQDQPTVLRELLPDPSLPSGGSLPAQELFMRISHGVRDAGHRATKPKQGVQQGGQVRMKEGKRRIAREKRTVQTLIEMYCSGHHNRESAMCEECQRLFAYAALKIDRCPFHHAKPVCAHCTIHCYSKGEREQIKKVMRFSGPRMLMRHPVLAFLHLIDGLRLK